MSAPKTRWELSDHGYGACFDRLIREGADIAGEARLADALAPRHARILDAGSGMGRVAAELVRRGHQVTAVEKDPGLIAQSRATYPDLPVVEADLHDVSADALGTFDLVVAVGNVVVFLAEGTEQHVLRRLRDLLVPGGRLLVGFHPDGSAGGSRVYPVEEFLTDATPAGLAVQHRFGSYDLGPPADNNCIFVLTAG